MQPNRGVAGAGAKSGADHRTSRAGVDLGRESPVPRRNGGAAVGPD